MTTNIDMSPKLQPAGAANGLVRENNQANQSKASQVVKSEELQVDKLNSEKLNADKLNADKLGKENATEVDKKQLESVVTNLNSSIQSVQRDLEFSVDDSSGQVVINVKDKETDKVVRQIPSEDAMKLAENLHELIDSRRENNSGSVEGLFVRTSA